MVKAAAPAQPMREPSTKKKLFRGRCIAIVGADGSGKSTMAQMLVKSAPTTTKYLYMGASIEASRIALPTSRLLVWLKRRRLKATIDANAPLPPADEMPDEMRSRLPGGFIVKGLAVVNRIAEEWYRQLYLWAYKARGYTVVCDRHFLYEYSPDSKSLRPENRPLSVRLHDGMLRRFFPRPDLTLHLDAPAEVLYARKPEWSIAHIERQRRGIVEQGQTDRRFVRVDATQPMNDVFDEMLLEIEKI